VRFYRIKLAALYFINHKEKFSNLNRITIHSFLDYSKLTNHKHSSEKIRHDYS